MDQLTGQWSYGTQVVGFWRTLTSAEQAKLFFAQLNALCLSLEQVMPLVGALETEGRSLLPEIEAMCRRLAIPHPHRLAAWLGLDPTPEEPTPA